MVEKTSRRKAFEEKIPEDVREHAKAARQELRESIQSLSRPNFWSIAVKHARKCCWLGAA